VEPTNFTSDFKQGVVFTTSYFVSKRVVYGTFDFIQIPMVFTIPFCFRAYASDNGKQVLSDGKEQAGRIKPAKERKIENYRR
jgi:hypothetical protein